MSDPTPLTLFDVRRMFEGVVPPAMCTMGIDGMPHVNYLSQAEYIDRDHVALTYQFFNRSRDNVLATRRAALSVDDPVSGAGVVLDLEYLRTETDGPLFERLRAKLAGIASQTGMQKVFRLRGADIYRVLSIRRVPGRRELPSARMRCDLTAGTRVLSERMTHCEELDTLLDTLFAGLAEQLLIHHAMLWLAEPERDCMVLLASRGYAQGSIGAEIALGEGLVGTAARVGAPIRVGHMTMMQTYSRAARRRTHELGVEAALGDELPLPGRVLGVLLVESLHDQYFSYDDEDALAILAGQLAVAFTLMQPVDPTTGAVAETAVPPQSGPPVSVRRYAQDNSIFLDDEYLIKGVAGAIFWKLARDHVERGRCEFTTRELRLVGDELRLPDVQDNVDVRLLLLQRRLAERCAPVQIERTGRGRYRFAVQRSLALLEA
jgi:adenylate cyclase